MTTPKQAWTEEPWRVGKDGAEDAVFAGDDCVAQAYGDSADEEEVVAAKIVADHNALLGIPDPAEWRRKVQHLIETLMCFEPDGSLYPISVATREAVVAILALQEPPDDD